MGTLNIIFRMFDKKSNLQGYSDSELTKQRVDWKEVFDFTPEVHVTEEIASVGVHGRNQWPTRPIEFEETMKIYLKVKIFTCLSTPSMEF